MAYSVAFADRIKDTSTTTGTGDFTLSGSPPTGFVSFNTAFGMSGQRFAYCIDSGGADWEVGVGYLSGATTLVRETVTASSNSGSAVNFGSGSKTIFNTFHAYHAADLQRRGRSVALSMGNWRP